MYSDPSLDPTELGAARAARPSPAAVSASRQEIQDRTQAVLAAAIDAEPLLLDEDIPEFVALKKAVQRLLAAAEAAGVETTERRASS